MTTTDSYRTPASSISSIPLVSIVVCAHNAGDLLAPTIDSALAQSYPNIELIVVDDGSTDQSVDELERRFGVSVRILRQENRGAGAALRAGLELASGELIALLDHDDLWEPDYLEAQVELLSRQPEIDLGFSWFRVIDRDGREVGVHSTRYRGTVDFAGLLTDFVIGASSNVVIRRAAVDRAGGVDASFPRLYDVDLFLRIALLRPGNIQAIPRELVFYRWHRDQISQELTRMQEEWRALMVKLRGLRPAEVGQVERRALCNTNRHFARIAYQRSQYREGLQLLGESFVLSPVTFLSSSRYWWTTAACLSGYLLPAWLRRALERLAGVRMEAQA